MEQSSQTTNTTSTPLPDLQKRYLTARERAGLKQSLELNAQIAAASSDNFAIATEGGSPVLPPGFNINKAKLTEQARATVKVLKDQTPPPLSAKEKDAIQLKVKALEAEILREDVLETFDEIHVRKRDNPAWMKAIQKGQKRPKWEAKIQELKNCRMLLNPDDEYADNLDYLRRSK